MLGISKLLGLERVIFIWVGYYFYEEVGYGVYVIGYGVFCGDFGIYYCVYKGFCYGVFWEIIGGW